MRQSWVPGRALWTRHGRDFRTVGYTAVLMPPPCSGCVMSRHRSLRGAVVVITGASSGIGRATALAFAAEGARLVLASRSQEALVEVERDCRARGAQVLVAPTDIADPPAVERLAQVAVQRF